VDVRPSGLRVTKKLVIQLLSVETVPVQIDYGTGEVGEQVARAKSASRCLSKSGRASFMVDHRRTAECSGARRASLGGEANDASVRRPAGRLCRS
jgi:hypothetical protein